MKNLLSGLILIFVLSNNFNLFSQSCLPGGTLFSTQAQIDNFSTNYPGCTIIEGNVEINDVLGEDIINLDGLSAITTIEGNLLISSNDYLISVVGLQNLTSIDGFFKLYVNQSLPTLNGLNNLTNVGGQLVITQQYSLDNVDGLENLESINGLLSIAWNTDLINLNGLSNLLTIDGYLSIYHNDKLTSLTGIQNIDPNSIEGTNGAVDLIIKDNQLLNQCEVQSICDLLNIPSKTTEILNNATGCSSQAEIEEACDLLNCSTFSVFGTPSNVTCYNGTDGAIDIEVSGGTLDYTYDWADITSGTEPEDRTNLSAGTYYLTVTDANSCTVEDEWEITQPAELSATLISTNLTCFGADDGTITITSPLGGNGTYEYTIDGGTYWQTSGSFFDLSASTYNIQMRDEANISCVKIINSALAITQPAELSASLTSTNLTCFGADDGTIIITSPSGGNGTYEYTIDGGLNWQTSGSFTALANATYNVQMRDAANISCVKILDDDLVITEPAELSATLTSTNLTCFGADDGTITITNPSGGNGTYEYTIDGGLNWQTSGSFTALANATYIVQMRDAANISCVKILDDDLVITEPAELSAAVSSTNISCFGADDGTITITSPTGGSGTYQYTIDGGSNWQTSGSLTALANATYNVQMRDEANISCFKVLDDDLVITEPAELSATLTSTNLTCFGADDGTITITNPSGGSGTYQYTIDGGSNWQTSGSFTALANATYNVQMRDAAITSCDKILNSALSITQPDELIPNATATEETGNGFEDGTASCEPEGGTLNYSYSWTASNGGSIPTGQQNNQNLTDLAPGNYTVNVTDGNNCTANQTVIVNQFGCTPFELETIFEEPTCFSECDGEATVSVVGGTPSDYTYLWEDGQDTQTATNLCNGTYLVTVTDATNCSESTSITITQPTTITISSTEVTSPILCNGGIANVSIVGEGGSGSLSYTFNGETNYTGIFSNVLAGDHEYSVTDENNCGPFTGNINVIQPEVLEANATAIAQSANGINNGEATCDPSGGTLDYTFQWNNGETTQSIVNLAPGDYEVTVTDHNLCTSIESVTVNEFGGCNSFTVNTSFTQPSCNGASDGTATAYPPSGSGTFTYNWSNNANNQTSQTATGLKADSYDVTLTDETNCDEIVSVEVTQPDVLSATINSTNISCFNYNNGSIIIDSPSGGSGDYQYTINNGINWTTNPAFLGLLPATYNVQMRDAQNTNCIIILDNELVISEPELLVVDAGENDIICKGKNTTLSANGSGGTATYNYKWNNGLGQGQSHQVNPTTQTTYVVTITDANNCTSTDQVTVYVNPLPNILTSSNSPICEGEEIKLYENGGDAKSWNWTGPNGFTSSLQNLEIPNATISKGGKYHVTITDNNGCASSSNTYIAINTKPKVIPVGNNVLCEQENLLLKEIGGDAISWKWSGPNSFTSIEQNPTISKASTSYSGIYRVIGIDDNSCKDTSKIDVTVNPKPEAKYEIFYEKNNSLVTGNKLQVGQWYNFNSTSISKETDTIDNFNWTFSLPVKVETSTSSHVRNKFTSPNNKAFANLIIENSNCIDTLNYDLIITDEPTAIISIGCGSTPSYCKGETICFDGYDSFGSLNETVDSYEWKLDGDIISTDVYFNYTFDDTEPHNVSLVIKDSGGSTSGTSTVPIQMAELKNDATIDDFSLCSNDEEINLLDFATGADKAFIQFQEAEGVDIDTKKFNPENINLGDGESKTITIKYTVQDGNCIGKIDEFIITVNKVDAVFINILNIEDKFCIGDSLILETYKNWIWTHNEISITSDQDGEEKFLLNSNNPEIKVYYQNEVTKCISEDIKSFSVSNNPVIPNLDNAKICNKDTASLNITLNDNENITWDQNEFITEIQNDSFIFYPNNNMIFDFTIMDTETTCTSDSLFKVEVIRVDPEIISLDKCEDKFGSIFTIKERPMSNPNLIEWTAEGLNIKEGENSWAVFTERNGMDHSILYLTVNEGLCYGYDTLVLNNQNIDSFLSPGTDSLAFESCGNIVYSNSDSNDCDGDYYLGWVDHDTGEYFDTSGISIPLYIDNTRNEESNRTYFINCEDCEETNILPSFEVREAINQGCSDIKNSMKVFVAPNPVMGEFNIYFKGEYRGELSYELYNSLSQKMKNVKYTKQKYSDQTQMDVDFKSGLYYLRIYNKDGFTATIPVILLN